MIHGLNLAAAAVLALTVSAAQAEKLTTRNWIVDTDADEFYYAATTNDAGHILGQFCYFDEDSCVYITGMGITCDEGHKYPAIINSDKGALSVELVCAHKVEEQNALLISPFDDIDFIIRSGTKMGIVIPMEGDRFKVARFSLIGSTQAIESMRASAKLRQNENQEEAVLPDEEFI